MNRSTLAALVVALMLGSGIAGYLIGKPGEALDRAPPRTASATPAPTPATPTAPAAPRPAAPTQVAQPAAAPNEAFAYRRLSLDSARPEGNACLAFNKPLATADTVKYADYVRISPDVKVALRPVDDKLCFEAAYGQDYWR